MKKIAALLVFVLCTLALTGCGLAWKTQPEEKEAFTASLEEAGIRWEAMAVLELWG